MTYALHLFALITQYFYSQVEEVINEDQVKKLLAKAQKRMAVASTIMNDQSSRSHGVFRLQLTGENSRSKEILKGINVFLNSFLKSFSYLLYFREFVVGRPGWFGEIRTKLCHGR